LKPLIRLFGGHESARKAGKEPFFLSKSSSESQDKKTGEIVEVDAVWVPKLRLRSKYESSTDSRSGSREYVTDQVSAQSLQAINKRVAGFVPWFCHSGWSDLILNRSCCLLHWV